MSIEPHYQDPGESLEEYDEIKARAKEMIDSADGFLVFTAYVTGPDEFTMKTGGGVRNIPAPVVLMKVAEEVEQLARTARDTWPGEELA